MFYTKLTELQIENTSICNLSCPMCLREHTPEDKSWFTETYLSLDFFKNNIPESVYNTVETVLFNGVLGDPCAAPNFLEVCEFIKSKDIKITISTNGSLRSTEFWHNLADILDGDDKVIFAIDGLEDTNHIYRVNSNWDKIMNNCSSFINNGGNSEWQYISFKHNQHQVEQARQLSKDMNFRHFYVKPSYRFIINEMTNTQHYGSNGVLLSAPTDDTQHHLIKIHKKFSISEWQQSSNTSKIDCYAIHNNSIYIDYLGRLYPCCPLASGQMVRRTVKIIDGWDELWDKHGNDKINLNHTHWDDIVNGPFFMNVKDSWTKDYNTGRLASCAGTCSNSELKFNHKPIE
jgi:MoaA/NifB/PqqE/SkfB family radical SAM enzyme